MRWLRERWARLWQSGEGAPAEAAGATATATEPVATLATMRPGQRGVVRELALDDALRAHKLMAMGVLPGEPIALNQRYPAYVFRLGHAQFTVDREIAAGVRVDIAAGRDVGNRAGAARPVDVH